MNFGNLMLVLAFAASGGALVAYFLWGRGLTELSSISRLLLGTVVVTMLLASAFQMWNIMNHQFQYAYVTNFSDRALPPLLRAASFWGGQAGSLMLWSTLSVVFGLVLAIGLRRSSWEPYVLTPYMLIVMCILGLTFASGPFRMLAQTPADGEGLNPLLQNYWMAIHPPILFSGFTTMAGPSVFAVAALWRRDFNGWVRLAQPWTLLAFICMGAGLALGGFWAYESLGWGGFWGWDPVENSSLVPWLFATALLHGLILQHARGGFKRTNLVLAIVGYQMVVYSTFLTRSGLWDKASVHSFVELGLLNYLLVFIAIFTVLGIGLLIWRWREIDHRLIYTSSFSREFGLLLLVVLIITSALIIGIATSMPVITMFPLFERRAMVDLSFYGPVVTPFGFLLVLTMAIGPLLGWRRAKYGSIISALKIPALIAVIVIIACLLLNILYPLALLFGAAAVFATATNAMVILRIWRAGPLKLGGYLCHIGVGLLFVGIAGVAFYKQTAPLQLVQDTPQMVFGQQFTLRGIVNLPDDPLKRTAIEIEVTNVDQGTTWMARTPYYVYQQTGQLVMHPAIDSNLWSDLYVAPSEYRQPVQVAPGRVQLVRAEPLEALGYTLTFNQFEIPDRAAMLEGNAPASVGASLDIIAPDGTTTTVTPMMQVVAGQDPQGIPVPLPGGATLTLAGVHPDSQMVTVQFSGIDLGTVNPEELKARAFIEVSSEPGIKFVWTGFIVTILGGVLALVRRWREARPAADTGQRSTVKPQGRQTKTVLQPGPAWVARADSEVQ